MGLLDHLKDFLTVASVLTLLMVGMAIALKSGVVAIGVDRSRLILGNLSHLTISLIGCFLVLCFIQQLIGIRLGSIW